MAMPVEAACRCPWTSRWRGQSPGAMRSTVWPPWSAPSSTARRSSPDDLGGPSAKIGTAYANDPVDRERNVLVLGPHHAAALSALALDPPGAGGRRRYEYVITHDRELIIGAALSLWARLPGA